MAIRDHALTTTGSMTLILRAEALAALFAGIVFYTLSGFSWVLFAALLLAPDLSLIGYTAGPQRGAFIYNAMHTYAAPLLFGAASALSGAPTGIAIAAIWVCHIALDRALGFGLKYGTDFKATHLGAIGR